MDSLKIKRKTVVIKSSTKLRPEVVVEPKKRRLTDYLLATQTINVLDDKPHLTFSIDESYFGGKAGQMRLLTLILATVGFGLGFPGYYQTETLYAGFGESVFIPLSMGCSILCILISTVFILLLLCFREVRCQAIWDDRNLTFHALGSFVACMAGVFELSGIFLTREANCKANPYVICKKQSANTDDDEVANEREHNLQTTFKEWHYSSCFIKFGSGLLYSACARIFLKNDERLLP